MRQPLLLCLIAWTGCLSSDPSVDAGSEAGKLGDTSAPMDGGESLADVGDHDGGRSQRFDAGLAEAGQPDAGPTATCPADIEGQPTLCIEMNQADSTPLSPHFSGLLVQDFRSGWQPWDARYLIAAQKMLPGFISLGAVYAWDWRSGSIPLSNVEVHAGKQSKYNQTLDFHKVTRGKGFIKVDDYARVAAGLGAKLVLEANVRSSARYADRQVDSIQAYAEHVARRGYPVLYWKLSSEPVYWSDSNWCDADQRPCTPFHEGGDGYAADMKPFFDAIAAGYAAAGQNAPPRVVHHTEGGHTERQRRFDGVQLDPETGTLEAWSGEGGIAYYGSLADRASHPERRKYWDDWGHNWFLGQNTYNPGGGDPLTCETDPETHWSHFQKHLNHILEHETVGAVDHYHLPVNGAEGFGTEPPVALKGNIGSYSVRATTPYTTTMYAALYAVESMLRWSQHPRLRSAGYFALMSNCMGSMATGRTEARRAGNLPQNRTFTQGIANSEAIDYQLYDHLPCLGLGLSNQAINMGIENLNARSHGGVQTTAHGIELLTGPARWVPRAEEQVPATFTEAYLGADGVTRVVITNRSDQAHTVELIAEGRLIRPGDILSAKSLSTPTANFRNYGFQTGSSRACVPPRPADHEDAQVVDLNSNNRLTIPAWSVNLVTFEVPPQTEIDAPGEPQVTPLAGALDLTWTPVAGATGYRVLWGTQPGRYTNRIEVAQNSLNFPYMDGIPVYFAVRSHTSSGTSRPSPEAQGQALPILKAHDAFTAETLNAVWQEGCANDQPWNLVAGQLQGGGDGHRCMLYSGTSVSDQTIQATISHGGWTDPPHEARFGLIGRYQNSQTFIFGGIRNSQEQGVWRKRAVIEIYHPSLPSGFLPIGTSNTLGSLAAENWFPQSLLTGEGLPPQLELEISGRTLRLFVHHNSHRRLLAAGIDSFKEIENGAGIAQEPNEIDLERSAAGQAGLFTQSMAAAFDHFQVR